MGKIIYLNYVHINEKMQNIIFFSLVGQKHITHKSEIHTHDV